MLQSTLNTKKEGEKKTPFTHILEAFSKILHHKQPAMHRFVNLSQKNRLMNGYLLGNTTKRLSLYLRFTFKNY